MFIEHSTQRVHLVRSLFLLAAVLPCFGLLAAAVWRSSQQHVEAVERAAEELLGIPLEIVGVDHLRPRALRLRGLELLDPSGGVLLALPSLDVEWSAGETRLSAARVDCTPAAAAACARLARDWLAQPERFEHDWVVDVADLRWILPDDGPAGHREVAASGLHAECVAAAEGRAMRLRREPATAEEIRIQTPAGVASAEGHEEPAHGTRSFDVRAVVDLPLPAAVVAAVLQPSGSTFLNTGLTAGNDTLIRGRLTAACRAGAWSGDIAGRLERIDLQAASAGGPSRITGEADIVVDALRFEAGRLVSCDLGVMLSGGWVPQPVVEAAVAALGCRAASAFRTLGRDPLRTYDAGSFRVLLDGSGLAVRGMAADGVVLRSLGLPVLEESATRVPPQRLSWMVSPAGREMVPASSATGWLLGVLPAAAFDDGGNF